MTLSLGHLFIEMCETTKMVADDKVKQNCETNLNVYCVMQLSLIMTRPAKIGHICTQNLIMFLNFNLQYLLKYKHYYNEIFMPYSQINKKAKKVYRT